MPLNPAGETPPPFPQIYETYCPRICRYLARLLTPDEAEDAAQDVFVKASRNLSEFRAESSLATWLYQSHRTLSRRSSARVPGHSGAFARNLGYMKAFAEAWPDQTVLQQLVAKLPWGHNVRLLDAVKNTDERVWYAEQAIANGWSRNVLVLQIESQLYHRQGKALTNFQRTLPPPQSDLAQQITKAPYNFDSLTLAAEAREKDLEASLLEHLR